MKKAGPCCGFITHDLRQVHHITIRLEKTFCNNEPPGQRLPSLFLGDLGEHPLQILHIIVLIPTNDTARDLNTFPDSEADTLIGNNDISTLRERRNNTGNGRKRLRVHDTSRGTKERRHIRLSLHMNILVTVESSGATGTDTVVPKGLDSRFLKSFVGVEIVKVVRSKIRNSTSIGKLRLGADGTAIPRFN